MEKVIRVTAIAPYNEIKESNGDVKYEITNFHHMVISAMFHQIGKIFEETKYISSFEMRSKVLPSFGKNETVLGVEIIIEESDSELK